MEKDFIEAAKRYAREQNRSLSDTVKSHLVLLTQENQPKEKRNFNPLVASLRGSFKMTENMDYKKELRKRLYRKYS